MRDTAGEVKTNTLATLSNGRLDTEEQVLDDLQELLYNSSVRTQDLVYKTCRKRWMIETNGERERERERERDER